MSTIPPPPPPLPPPPPPPSSGAVKVFPDVTDSAEFATLGLELSGNTSAPLTMDGYTVRYDAVSGAYIFDLPSSPAGAFHASSNGQADPTYWSGGLVTSGANILWPPMTVLKSSASNPAIQLEHTSFAAYQAAGPMEDRPHGFVAFGSPTPSAGIPTSGTATMNAMVAGQTFDQLATIGGTATLQFNFGAGTLAGAFNPILYPYYEGGSHALGQYSFVNTVYGVGSTTFSGKLVHANPSLTGAFDGLFTGPNAQELMARWTADYSVPGGTGQSKMFGVWVGKKCC